MLPCGPSVSPKLCVDVAATDGQGAKGEAQRYPGLTGTAQPVSSSQPCAQDAPQSPRHHDPAVPDPA
jgi:hypothetical protein